jgi:hypothetical protein
MTLVFGGDNNTHNVVYKPENYQKSFLAPSLIFLEIFSNQCELQVAIVPQKFKFEHLAQSSLQAQIWCWQA